jgi:hypothetical protein
MDFNVHNYIMENSRRKTRIWVVIDQVQGFPSNTTLLIELNSKQPLKHVALEGNP